MNESHYWETEDYKKFIDKFKPKLTTDDCFTPPAVYEVVKGWAIERYGLHGRPIVRPFYPGGDYEVFDYPAECVVIDNPPFSIFSKICKFYLEKKIDFFLFAPSLTLFSSLKGQVNAVITDSGVIYENGAKVATSFATNLGEYLVETVPDLNERIKEAQKKDKPVMLKYEYPANLITVAKLGIHFRVKKGMFVRALDNQRENKKAIYGGGYLISTQDAEILRAEMPAKAWLLSERERLMIAKLDEEVEKEARDVESKADLFRAEA